MAHIVEGEYSPILWFYIPCHYDKGYLKYTSKSCRPLFGHPHYISLHKALYNPSFNFLVIFILLDPPISNISHCVCGGGFVLGEGILSKGILAEMS